MDVYDAFGKVVDPFVPEYLMSQVNQADAKFAYGAFLEFKDVVKAHPIKPAEDVSSVKGGESIAAAAKTLSSAAYPFLQGIDWSSNLALKNPGTASPKDVLKAVDKALVMGAAMDGAALKEAAMAHSKAIASMDAKGVTTLGDFEAINTGLGK